MASATQSHPAHGSSNPSADRFWTRPAVTWAVRVLLAVAVLGAGAAKLFASADTLDDSPFPPWFLRAIGSCEILGAFVLVLPGLLRTQRWLTPLAAIGLVIIMTGATVTELAMGNWASAPVPVVLGLMAGFVAWSVGSAYGAREGTEDPAWPTAARWIPGAHH